MSASSHRPLVGALLGAAATFVALVGAVAIADTPRQLSDVTQSLVSTEVFEIMPASSAALPETQARAPASTPYEEGAPQVTVDMYA